MSIWNEDLEVMAARAFIRWGRTKRWWPALVGTAEVVGVLLKAAVSVAGAVAVAAITCLLFAVVVGLVHPVLGALAGVAGLIAGAKAGWRTFWDEER